MPRIVGPLLAVQDVEPYRDRQTGAIQRQGFQQLVILDGLDTARVRLPDDFNRTAIPAVGTECAVQVTVRPYVERGGQSAAVSYTAVEILDSPAGRRVQAAAASS